jgi:hypothetical protein
MKHNKELRRWGCRAKHLGICIVALSMSIVGCGGGSSGQTSPSSQPPSNGSSNAASTALSIRAEVERLERDNVLPTLDRSSDVAGPDLNGDGVRDDVGRYIDALPITEPQKKAALQRAKVQQRALTIDLSNRRSVKALAAASMAATACIGDQFEPDRRRSYEISRAIEAITSNTPERSMRYMEYMRALSGTSTGYPDGKACEP